MGVVLPQPISFGKYTLFERIGRGGMADVFKARVQGPGGFERIFVIKRILPHLSDDPTFTKMFMEEAKLAARLNHPNIVQVFELDSVDGEYFMSMEYVRGRDLAETMRTLWARVGPPRPELVAYVGREMCRALAYAHDFTADDGTRLGMIHRDISPSNVMLSVEGAVKLLDFGIAKALTGDNDETTTKSGTLKGKFAYMAPEQTMSNEVDRRIDIFATGIVLHEILTGRRLFKGENDLQTIEKVRQCNVLPPSLHNPLCPAELDEIVLKALSKDSQDRFQNGSEMAEALDDIVHAARFQPTQLAQLMTSLFPTDSGTEARSNSGSHSQRQPITGSVSPSRSNLSNPRLTTTGSTSHSGRVTSTTVPPVPPRTGSIPRMGSGLTPVVPPPVPADIDLRRKSVFSRKSTWAIAGALALAVGGFWFGARGSRSNTTRPGNTVVITRPPIQTETLDLAIQSNPAGAEVFVVGSNESLGKTPFRRKFDYREDKAAFLLFRLAGYRDLTHEIRPDWSGLVVLDPEQVQPPPPPEVKPVPPPAPAKPNKGAGSRSGHKKEPTGHDPFETGQGGPSRNVGRAANPF